MISMITERLLFLCDTIPDKISAIPQEDLEFKKAVRKWSKKEILGHLVDSAANNHQRFVRAQFQASPVIYYDQNEWVSVQNYQIEHTDTLLNLWEHYNRHLVHVIAGIATAHLKKQCIGRDGTGLELGFLVKDYLDHLEYHLKQIVNY